MSRYNALYSAISKLEANHKTPNMLPAYKNFPFAEMYEGQRDILDAIPSDKPFVLCSHTGFGKSAVFITLTRETPSIIIEPRVFLQKQISGYKNDFVLMGRAHYPCPYAPSASSSPCLLKIPCHETEYSKVCKRSKEMALRGQQCDGKCMIFPTGAGFVQYPCQKCEYMRAQRIAVEILNENGTVICNFGNFWQLLKHCTTVVVDEADLFFRSISEPMRLRYSTPKHHGSDSVKILMDREVKGLQGAAKDPDASFRYKVQNQLYNAKFLLKYSDLCFTYQRKDRIYVEIDPRNTNILSQKLFADKRVIIVSATPGQFDLPSYSASIHQRCGIFFAPVGNLTSKNLKQNPYLMNSAAKAITEISEYFELMYEADRVVIHTGNLGTHAKAIFANLGEDNCTLHESGKLAETIETFLKSGKKYLLVAAAEHGGDFSWCKLQFILKFPYPTLDERMNTLKRTMGPAFSSFYEGEARTRVIQMGGRNVRGFDDFGVTICLDSKCLDDFRKNSGKYPDWYRERVDTRCY